MPAGGRIHDRLSTYHPRRTDCPRSVRQRSLVGVQHGGIKDASYGSGLSFRDPDGIALEFFAPPS
jgi:glyoxylase I family protein